MNTNGLGQGWVLAAGKLIHDRKGLIADGVLALYLALVWQIPNYGCLGCNAHEGHLERCAAVLAMPSSAFSAWKMEAHGRSIKSKVMMPK